MPDEGDLDRVLQRPFEMTAESRSGRLLPVEVSVVQATVLSRPLRGDEITDLLEAKIGLRSTPAALS